MVFLGRLFVFISFCSLCPDYLGICTLNPMEYFDEAIKSSTGYHRALASETSLSWTADGSDTRIDDGEVN